MLDWKLTWGEWVLTGWKHAATSTGWQRAGQYILSPSGPPFRYRGWNREGKDWIHHTLDHCTTIEEAKACLSTIVRLS